MDELYINFTNLFTSFTGQENVTEQKSIQIKNYNPTNFEINFQTINELIRMWKFLLIFKISTLTIL